VPRAMSETANFTELRDRADDLFRRVQQLKEHL
jgi:tetrahydromethanopterin S-methyltransferase subunit G